MAAKPDTVIHGLPVPDPQFLKDRSGLHSPGWLAKWPLIGLVMILLGGMLFGAMVINLQTNGPLVQTDLQVASDIHRMALQGSPVVRDVMIFGFYLGEHGILAIGALFGLYFLFKRRWAELGMIVVAWAGEGSLWLILSAHFNRLRPVFDVAVWHQMTSPGFPSGHAISAVMCFGLVAYVLMPAIKSHIGKITIFIVALLIILYIGYSRIFVGDHYLTDVLAGYGLGIAWSGFVYTTVDLMAFRRRSGGRFEANQAAVVTGNR